MTRTTPSGGLQVDRDGISSGDWVVLCASLVIVSWALAAVLFALLGLFKWWIVVPVAISLSMLAVRAVPRARTGMDVWWWLALGVAIVTVFINGLNPGEHVLTGRDSGTYLATAGWLANQSTLIIDGNAEVFAAVDEVRFGVPGFYEREADVGTVRPQFMHAFPAMLATLIQVGGIDLGYWLNPVLGAVLLIALHALSRRYMRPWAAFLAVVIVATSLVFLFYARTPFTEVMMATLVLSGLAMLGLAEERSNERLLVLAGAVLGATVLVRLDGVLLLLPVTFYFLVRSHGELGTAYKRARYAMFMVALFGVAESLLVSPEYVLERRGSVGPPLLVILLVLLASDILGPWIARWRSSWAVPNLGKIYWTLVVLGGLALTYAWVARPSLVAPVGGVDLSVLQLREGLEVQARSYAELSVVWLAWYQGAGFVVLAFVGTAVLFKRALGEQLRSPSWLVPLLLLTFSVLYLWRPSITPDHIWAARRYLTVVIPLGALAAAMAADFIVARFERRHGPQWQSGLVGFALTLALVFPPAAATAPVWDAHELEGMTDDLRAMCEELNSQKGVLVVGHSLAQYIVQSLRSFCGISAAWVEVTAEAEFERVLERGTAAGLTILLAASRGETAQYLDGDYQRLSHTLSRRPTEMSPFRIGMTVGG